ncbi:MAG: hypothetical protein Q9166_007359 [cf. Caloplaca sp. 2 TL-2023]
MPTLFPASHSVHINGDTAAKVREWSSVIGIVTAIVGNILISFALNIQRYAHIRLGREKDEQEHGTSGQKSYGTQQEEIAEQRLKANLGEETEGAAPTSPADGHYRNGSQSSKRLSFGSESSSQSTVKPPEKTSTPEDTRTYLSSPYWWAGIVLMIIGEGGNFLAYGFAPASIVSPLGVVALVSNCIIAPVLLKEQFRQKDFWGVLVAIAGAVTVVLSAKNSETKMGPHHIWLAITRWEFELYLGITAALIIILLWASGKYGEKSILIDLGLVGLFGGYTALSTKGIASLLSDTLWRTFTFPITYLLLAVLVGSAVLQIRHVNRALQRFDSTQVIPTQFVLFTLSVIIGSAVLYRDFKSATAARIGKFIGGCLLTFLGVYLITSGRSREGDDMDDHLDDEEEAIGLVDEEARQDEAEVLQADNTPSRRKSSVSEIINGSSKSSRKSSHHTFSGQSFLPHTPLRQSSITSSALSRSSTNQYPETPLTENPWTNSQNYYTPPTRPRNSEPSISTPLLPSDAQRSDSPTPSQSRRLSPSKADRPSTLSRNSIAHLRPRPLMFPLSPSLSAIVADSLRRGVHDSPSLAAAARRRPRLDALRKSRSVRAPAEAEDVDARGSPLKNVRRNEDRESNPTSSSEEAGDRKQSISAALDKSSTFNSMADIIRDAPVGQIIRFMTRNRILKYPEEKPDFKLPESYNTALNSFVTAPLTEKTSSPISPSRSDAEAPQALERKNTTETIKSVNSNDDLEAALTRTKSRENTQQWTEERLEIERELSLERTKSVLVAPTKTPGGNILVDWYTTDDPANPQNWSNSKRAFVALLICLYTFAVYSGSAIYTSSTLEVESVFHVGPTAASLPLALYVLAYGIGPLLYSPLSEIPLIGRNPVYATTFTLFVILSIPTALAKSFAGLLVLRFLQGFLGSPCLATGGASMQDMYSLLKLPYAMTFWVSAAYCGPALGPLLSGFAVPVKGWRWSLWEIVWISAPVLILMLLFVPETSTPNILLRRASRLRKLTGDNRLKAQSEIDQKNLKPTAVAIDALIKPLEITVKDPAIAFVNIYSSIVYAIYYSFFEVFPLVYGPMYGFNIGQTGVVFLCVFVACVIGVLTYTSYLYFYLVPDILRNGLRAQEHRLVPALICVFGPVIGLFIFAWTANPSIHWMASVIGITIYAACAFVVFQCIFVYVPMSYPNYAASLFASNDFFRSSLACAAILFARPLFINLGVGKGTSLLGGLSVLGVIGMWVLWWVGAKLRARSKFAVA